MKKKQKKSAVKLPDLKTKKDPKGGVGDIVIIKTTDIGSTK